MASEQKNKRGNKFRVVIIGSVIPPAIAIVIVHVLSSIMKPRQPDHSNLPLYEILNPSFSAEFSIHKYENSSWIDQNETAFIEFDGTSLRFEDVLKISKYYVISTTTFGEDIATATIQHDGKQFDICYDISHVHFFPIIKATRNATKVQAIPELTQFLDCPNSELWTATGLKNSVPIYYCVKDKEIVKIRQRRIEARVTKWNSPTTEKIKMPKNMSCKPSIKTVTNLDDSYKRVIKNTAPAKDCLFIHGTGENTGGLFRTLNDSFEEYWGFVGNFTERCMTRSFVHMDTVSFGWDHPKLQKYVCDAADVNRDGHITDTIVFSHSMGNLIFAAALKNKHCNFDKGSSEWYSVQAPWKGSRAADFIRDACHLAILPFIFKEEGASYCNGSVPSNVYKTMATDNVSNSGVNYKDLIEIAKRYVTGALCGTSGFGIGYSKQKSIELQLIQLTANLEQANDGMVALESCDIFGTFKDHHIENFYKGPINHSEGRCKYDENWNFGTSSDNQKPCHWYNNR